MRRRLAVIDINRARFDDAKLRHWNTALDFLIGVSPPP
jgi:hypothetical protein